MSEYSDLSAVAVANRLGLDNPSRIWPACGCGDGSDDEDPTAGTGDPAMCQGPVDVRVLGRKIRSTEDCPCPCHGGIAS